MNATTREVRIKPRVAVAVSMHIAAGGMAPSRVSSSVTPGVTAIPINEGLGLSWLQHQKRWRREHLCPILFWGSTCHVQLWVRMSQNESDIPELCWSNFQWTAIGSSPVVAGGLHLRSGSWASQGHRCGPLGLTKMLNWLVVPTLWEIITSQPTNHLLILGKVKKVWNHQPVNNMWASLLYNQCCKLFAMWILQTDTLCIHGT